MVVESIYKVIRISLHPIADQNLTPYWFIGHMHTSDWGVICWNKTNVPQLMLDAMVDTLAEDLPNLVRMEHPIVSTIKDLSLVLQGGVNIVIDNHVYGHASNSVTKQYMCLTNAQNVSGIPDERDPYRLPDVRAVIGNGDDGEYELALSNIWVGSVYGGFITRWGKNYIHLAKDDDDE